MGINRRDFLKGLGGTVAALGAAGVVEGLVSDRKAEAIHQAAPLTGTIRWGMVVDVAAFRTEEDFRRCEEACHKYHNVPRFNSLKDEIKWIWSDRFENVFPSASHQFVSEKMEEQRYFALCNHCANPPCVRVCPTQATFKDTSNGITMMDWHRCIGCRFCMAACPYGARSFNWRDPRPFIPGELNPDFPTRERGVVEKCTFCAEVIALGEAPGPGEELPEKQMPRCVKASEGRLVFGNLKDPESQIRRTLKATKTIQRKPQLGTQPSVFYIV
ncbi:MAG: 4Fe-4S dicluster domain-containing protein [Nitrospirota bacterium]|jgi:Fe-S-cluster-containing dehydrogenase component